MIFSKFSKQLEIDCFYESMMMVIGYRLSESNHFDHIDDIVPRFSSHQKGIK